MTGSNAVKKAEDIDLGQLVVSSVTSFVKRRPVTISTWIFGLLVAALGTGFTVSDDKVENYGIILQQAKDFESKEFSKALRELQDRERRYYNLKGWFSCDDKCTKAYDRYIMAKSEHDRVLKRRNNILTEARKEVGIWSTFGVKDVRDSFWAAWQSGKDFASRCTMYDALFVMIGGREETAVTMIMKLVMQYIFNLTLGLCGAVFFFLTSVYGLVVDYGEPMFSGIAFFLLVVVASISTLGAYLGAIYGTVVTGGIYAFKKAQEAALENERNGGPRARVQYDPHRQRPGYGRGPSGPGRYHSE